MRCGKKRADINTYSMRCFASFLMFKSIYMKVPLFPPRYSRTSHFLRNCFVLPFANLQPMELTPKHEQQKQGKQQQ